MSDQSRSLSIFLKGSVITFLATTIGAGLAFAIRLLAARHLGTDGYGLFVLGLVVLDVAVLFPLLGFHQSLPRELPRRDNPIRLFLSTVAISVPLSAVVAVVVFVEAEAVAGLFREPGLARVLLVFALAMPLVTVHRLAVGTFRGFEDAVGGVVAQNVLRQLPVLLAIGGAIVLNLELLGFAQWWLGGTVVATGLIAGLLAYRIPTISWRSFRPSSVLPRGEERGARGARFLDFVTFSIPLMFSGMLWDMMLNIDNLVLGWFLDSSAVGIYDAAYTLGRVILLFTTALAFLFLPMFSGYHEAGNDEQMTQFFQLANKWLVLSALPVVVTLVVMPDVLLRTLFGPGFTGGVVLVIIAIGFFVHLAGGLNNITLVAMGESRVVLYGVTLAFVVNAVLNVVLVPTIGINGAAVASAIAYVCLNAFYSGVLVRRFGIHQFTRRWWRSLLFGIGYFGGVVIAAGVLFGAQLVPVIATVSVASVGYVLLIVTVIGIDDVERELLHALLNRLRARAAS